MTGVSLLGIYRLETKTKTSLIGGFCLSFEVSASHWVSIFALIKRGFGNLLKVY